MNIVQRIAKNTGVIIAGDIVNKAIGLVVVIFLARYLGAVGYGKYAFVLAYLTFFGIITDLGINTILVREISRDKSLASKYIGNAAVMKLILSILAVASAAIIITFMPYPADTTTYVYIMSLTLLFNSFSMLYSCIFQVELKMEYNVIANLVNRVLSAGLIFWIIFSKGTLLQIIIVLAVSSFVGMLINYFYLRKFVRPRFEVDFGVWKHFVKESWPLALTGIFITIYMRIDQVMLSMMIGNAAVGYYAAAVTLVESLGIIPGAFMISVYPLMSEHFSSSKEMHEKTYRLSFKYMTTLIIPIAVATTLLAEPVIRFFYGTEFSASIPVLRILIWSVVFIFFGVINQRILISANKQKFDAVFTCIAGITNYALNFMLIPKYGIVGAAVATVISYSIGSGAVLGPILHATRVYSLSGWKCMIKPLIVSSIMGIYIYYTRFYPPLAIIGGATIFVLLMFLIQGFDAFDIQLIRRLFKYREEKSFYAQNNEKGGEKT